MSQLGYKQKELFTQSHCPKWAKTELEARFPTNLSSCGLLTSSFFSPLALFKFSHTKRIVRSHSNSLGKKTKTKLFNFNWNGERSMCEAFK